MLWFDSAIQLNPGDALAYVSRGLGYGLLGQHEAEIQDYSEAIRLRPDDFIGYYNRAVAHK